MRGACAFVELFLPDIFFSEIVIKVDLNCLKCRTKAMEVAAIAYGVTSVTVDGDDKDKVVVIGEDVDTVALTSCLRKKVGDAIVESVEVLKPNDQPSASQPPEEACPPFAVHVPPMNGTLQFVVYEPYPPPNTCCIM